MLVDNSIDASNENVQDEEIEDDRNMCDTQSRQLQKGDILLFPVEDIQQLEHEDDVKSELSTEGADTKNLGGDDSMARG